MLLKKCLNFVVVLYISNKIDFSFRDRRFAIKSSATSLNWDRRVVRSNVGEISRVEIDNSKSLSATMLATFSTTKRSKWNYQTIMKISSMRSYRARTAIASQQCHHMWKQRKNIDKLSRRGDKQMLHTKIANAKERETMMMRLLCLAHESTKALVSTPSRAACAFFSSLYTSVFFVCAQTPRNDIVLQSLCDVRNKQKIKRCFVHVTWARLLTNEKKINNKK